MRVCFRSAPVLVALSVALAGCGQTDPPGSKSSTKGGGPSNVSANTAPDAGASSEYVLTVEGMT
jgi:hypothetical protein